MVRFLHLKLAIKESEKYSLSDGSRIFFINDDLPEPLTPVMAHKTPSGILKF